jgi:hypothetical protein
LKKVWQQSILTISDQLDLSKLNLDGTHTLAKKGGESVAYQGRKKGKTCNILPITDGNGYLVATTGTIAGNHNDAYQLKLHLQTAFKAMKRLGLPIEGAYFNADMAFDTKAAKPASIMASFPIFPKIRVIGNNRNEDAHRFSTKPSTNTALALNAPLLGWTNSNGCLSDLKGTMLAFWVPTTWLLP